MAALGEDLLKTVNRLQDLVFSTVDNELDLPQIVVVGSQSSGKSSVLENIVGKDFLPRGSGIVTRRPLCLQLINVPKGTKAPAATVFPKPRKSRPDGTDAEESSKAIKNGPVDEWAEFNHKPGDIYHDFELVKTEIEYQTSRMAGINKGISDLPIELKIFSSHVVGLTLVDLPGLTKIPLGDQPTNIEEQIRELIKSWVERRNSIILAVTQANNDLANSDSLKLAKEFDPTGSRTIGVLTKLDLMDHGTNALELLSGKAYPLKLGWIGVVNRSQQDINRGKPLRQALDTERDFFSTHPAYRNMKDRCGTAYLAEQLRITLMNHIRTRLPEIKARLTTLMGQRQQELANYTDSHFSGKEHRGSLILQLMTRFANSFISSIDGTSSEISTKELSGGARIYNVFNSIFGHALKVINPIHNLTVLDIRTAIRNSTGPRPSLFVPELAFDLLVKPQIKLLEDPSQDCVDRVYEQLIKICHSCGSEELSRYPRLKTKLIEVVSDLLRERLGPTSSYVESLIAIQRAYINTNHPNFLGAEAAMSSVLQARHEKEKERRLLADQERRKRERREAKEAGMNGMETPEEQDEDEEPHANGAAVVPHHVAVRQVTHQSKVSRSMSPAIHKRDVSHALANGSRAGSPPPGTKVKQDSPFYYNFFNKAAGGAPAAGQSTTLAMRASSTTVGAKRRASVSVEPSPSQSVKRIAHGEEELMAMSSFIGVGDEHGERLDVPFEYAGNGIPSETNPLTEREQMETELIQRLISSYFNIVRQIIADQVPKAVMHLLVNYSKDAVQNRLVSELYKEDMFDEMLHEDGEIKHKREKCERLLKTYKEAARIVGEVL